MQVVQIQEQKHFILVHGACVGAWVWHKLKPRLESAGHRVTALDLSACGINLKRLEELRTFEDYSLPLMETMAALPQNEKVILVGHSFGGLSLALAMDKFPLKISVAVFLEALMPDTTNQPSYVLEEYSARTPIDAWMDCQFGVHGDPPITSVTLGPEFLASVYSLCPIEDFTLGTLLVRPGSLFIDDLTKADKFTEKGFGSVPRVYIVCEDDKTIPVKFQRWMIENNPAAEVKELVGSDHMPMSSKPDDLCKYLLEIADKYA